MLDDNSMSNIILGNMGIYKGAIYENIIADAFIKNKIPLYYFSKNSGLEIDFIIRYQENISLIQVKARNRNTKSANTVLNDKIKYPNVTNLIKLCESNISYSENKFIIPYYLAFMIK